MKYFKSLVLFVFLVSITSCHGGAHVNQHDISGEIDSPTTSVHSLIQSLESDSNGELRNTIKNLRLMGGEAKSAIPKLLEIMSDPPRYSSKVQMEAMLAVANIAPENKEVVNSLLLKLGHRDEEIRKKALEAIYNTGAKDPSIINAIEQLSKEDHSRMVRKVAQDYYRSLKLQTLVESRE